MRDVQFQEVGMENFGPYIDPMILKFPNGKLTLLTGPNGIGKTMSLDAIPFTLYGITSKTAKGDDVVNNVKCKDCKTWLKFKINEDKYIITRYHKYSKLGNTVILNQNKVDIRKGQREVLPEIERLLCSQKAFMNTLMFGQKIKDFFTDLIDSDKKEIFRKILSLEQYITYYKQGGIKLKELEDLINEAEKRLGINAGLLEDTLLQIKILTDSKTKFYEEKQNNINTLKESHKENEKLLNSWQNELDIIQVDLNVEDVSEELNKIQNKTAILDKDTSVKLHELQHQKENKKMKLEVEATKTKSQIKNSKDVLLSEFRTEETKLKADLNDMVSLNQKERHNLELQIEKIESKSSGVSERIYEINRNVLEQEISMCPTCEQDVTKDTVDKLIIKVENFQSEIQENQKIIDELQEKREEMTKNLVPMSDEFHNKISNVNLKMKSIIVDQEKEYVNVDIRLQNAIDQVNEAVISIKNDLEKEQVKNKQELKKRETTLIEKKQSQEKQTEKIKEIEKTINFLSQKIDSVNNQIEYKENEPYDPTQLDSYIKKERDIKISIEVDKQQFKTISKRVSIYKFWKTGFSSSGIPSMLIDDSIPFMNKKITEYLELLTNGRYIVSFDTLDETKAGDFRDKISVRVIDTHTKANSRVQLSGGQTRLIDIATILTLGDLQSNIQDVKFNILLFDEIFDALDYENANYVSKVLNKLKIDKSIYVISHQHQDHLEPDETLSMR